MPPRRQDSGRNRFQNAVPPTEADVKPAIESLDTHEREDAPTDVAAGNVDHTLPSPARAPVDDSPAAIESQKAAPSSRGINTVGRPRRGVRRPQASRDAAAQAEAEKLRVENEAKAKAKLASTRGGARGRGRGRANATSLDNGDGRGRGAGYHKPRGGYMGQSMRELKEPVASGPFSAGQSSRERPRRGGWGTGQAPSQQTQVGSSAGSGRSDAAVASTRRSAGGSTSGSATTIKRESSRHKDVKPVLDGDGDIAMGSLPVDAVHDGGYVSSDEDEDDNGLRRMNVEDLGVIDLTKDDDDFNLWAPVRVQRIEHKEKARYINADGAKTEAGDVVANAHDKAAAKQGSKDIDFTGEKMKFQSTYVDSDSEAENVPAIKPDPEPRLAPPHESQDTLAPAAADLSLEPPSSPEMRRKGKEKIKKALSFDEPLPVPADYQTQEELAEWERYQDDLRVLRNEIGESALEEDGNATMKDAERKDMRSDKVYLFQFPPVVPDLEPVAIKPDPESNTDAAQDATAPAPKAEAVTIPDEPQHDAAPKLPSGAVGKLRVHASGRVTLDWGGTSLCLGMGTEASFLQDIIVANMPDEKKSEVDGVATEKGSGVAMSMGQVKGKFVVTPDWDEIL